MRTTDRDPRQSTLFADPAARRPQALDIVAAVRDAQRAPFSGWTEGLGRSVVRSHPVARLAAGGLGL